jgi:hypothetical protein
MEKETISNSAVEENVEIIDESKDK